MFCVEERQQYRLRIDLLVNKNVKELRYVHYFKKLRMRWLNKEFSLGPLALQNDVQNIALPFQTAPQGKFVNTKSAYNKIAVSWKCQQLAPKGSEWCCGVVLQH
ncbi:unnamed protein product [Cylicostephanus goldi]|uniref:Uncharacterized protein n=1 Tax=Cylicostephanus goldi TaxID=71465 RepID=A0A3P6ULP9_CYLGO|nr:unnamed protein product [Cylicostephanus goldi]